MQTGRFHIRFGSASSRAWLICPTFSDSCSSKFMTCGIHNYGMIMDLCQVWKPYAEGFSGFPRMDPEGTVGRIAQFRPHSQCARTWIPAGIPIVCDVLANGNSRMAGSKFPQPFCRRFRGFVLLLGYIGIPLLAGWLVSGMIDILTFGLLGIVSLFPLCCNWFRSPLSFPLFP